MNAFVPSPSFIPARPVHIVFEFAYTTTSPSASIRLMIALIDSSEYVFSVSIFAAAMPELSTFVAPEGASLSSLAISTFSFATLILSARCFTSQSSNASMLWNFIFLVIVACFLTSTPGNGIWTNTSSSSSFAVPSATPVASPALISVCLTSAKPSSIPDGVASSRIGESLRTRLVILFTTVTGTTAPVFAVVNVNARVSSSVSFPNRWFPL